MNQFTANGTAGKPACRNGQNIDCAPTAWQRAWRAIAAELSTSALQALLRGLEHRDGRIIQTGTMSPPPLQCCEDMEVEAGCAICYALWQGDYRGAAGVAELERTWAETLWKADHRLGEAGFVRFFLNWHDEAERETMMAALAAEVRLALAQRQKPDGHDLPERIARVLGQQGDREAFEFYASLNPPNRRPAMQKAFLFGLSELIGNIP